VKDNFIIHTVTALYSGAGGTDQGIHLDYVFLGEETVVIGVVPITGKVQLRVCDDASAWFMSGNDLDDFNISDIEGMTRVVESDVTEGLFFPNSLGHGGKGYATDQHRLHVVLVPRNRADPLPRNVTYLFGNQQKVIFLPFCFCCYYCSYYCLCCCSYCCFHYC
jgi:hypothetical protein